MSEGRFLCYPINSMVQTTLQNSNQARLVYTRAITALLCEPEKEVVQTAAIYRELEQSMTLLLPEAKELVANLEKEAQLPIKKLLVEYASLFIGPFKLLVPPYASCYLGKKQLNSEIADHVREFYLSAGLEYDHSLADLPDHIAVETEFIHFLLSKMQNGLQTHETKAEPDYADIYNRFTNDHYKKWVPEMCRLVIVNSRLPFYQNLFSLIQKTTALL